MDRDRDRERTRKEKRKQKRRDKERSRSRSPRREKKRHRSRSRSPRRDRERSKERKRSERHERRPSRSRSRSPQQLKEEQEIEEVDDEAQMQALMGFGGFGTTKGQQVANNDVGATRKEKSSKIRQYMNRPNGLTFLDPI